MSKRVPHLHSVHTIVYFIYSFFFSLYISDQIRGMGKLFHFFELKKHIRPLGKTDGKY